MMFEKTTATLKLKAMKTTRFIALTVTAVIISTLAKAQATVGISAGGSFNKTELKLSGLPESRFAAMDKLNGAEAGLFLSFPAGPLYVKPMALAGFYKGTITYSPEVNIGDTRFSLSSLEVPVLAGLDLMPFLSVEAGPSWNYVISHTSSADGTSINFDRHTLGYRAGARLNFGSLGVFGHYGGMITKNEGSQAQLKRPQRIIIGLTLNLNQK